MVSPTPRPADDWSPPSLWGCTVLGSPIGAKESKGSLSKIPLFLFRFFFFPSISFFLSLFKILQLYLIEWRDEASRERERGEKMNKVNGIKCLWWGVLLVLQINPLFTTIWFSSHLFSSNFLIGPWKHYWASFSLCRLLLIYLHGGLIQFIMMFHLV